MACAGSSAETKRKRKPGVCLPDPGKAPASGLGWPWVACTPRDLTWHSLIANPMPLGPGDTGLFVPVTPGRQAETEPPQPETGEAGREPPPSPSSRNGARPPSPPPTGSLGPQLVKPIPCTRFSSVVMTWLIMTENFTGGALGRNGIGELSPGSSPVTRRLQERVDPARGSCCLFFLTWVYFLFGLILWGHRARPRNTVTAGKGNHLLPPGLLEKSPGLSL